MKNKIFVLSLFAIFIFAKPEFSIGQTDSLAKIKLQIGFVPQHIIHHGVRIDIEPVFKNKKHSILISPQFFFDEVELEYDQNPRYYDNTINYEKLMGAGIGLHHKIFAHYFNSNTAAIYFAYGGEYVHFAMDYKNWEWTEYTDEGLQYLEYKLIPIQQNTDRIRVDMFIGVQFNYAENLFLDFYMGTGGVYSISKVDPSTVKVRFKNDMYDYAFTGIYIPIGFRFGLRF